jgi:hypothetical protein
MPPLPPATFDVISERSARDGPSTFEVRFFALASWLVSIISRRSLRSSCTADSAFSAFLRASTLGTCTGFGVSIGFATGSGIGSGFFCSTGFGGGGGGCSTSFTTSSGSGGGTARSRTGSSCTTSAAIRNASSPTTSIRLNRRSSSSPADHGSSKTR